MTPEETAIARRFMACQGFQWSTCMPIAPLSHPRERWILTALDDDGTGAAMQDGQWCSKRWGYDGQDPIDLSGWVPVITDDAFLGLALAMVREAWADPKIHIQWSAHWRSWYAYDGHSDQLNRLDGAPLGRFATEIEALLAALEAAPQKDPK